MLAERVSSTCGSCGHPLRVLELLGASISICPTCSSRRRAEQVPPPIPAWKRAGIPEQFAAAHFEQWRPWVGKKWPSLFQREGLFLSTTEEAVELVRRLGRWTAAGTPGFMISGTPGRGKTQLASAYLVRELQAGRPGRFISDVALALLLGSNFRTPEFVRGTLLLHVACSTPFLVYDDLLMGGNPGMARAIILARHNARLQTLFTCGLTAVQLKERFADPDLNGAPIYGRLREMCGLNWSWQAGPDLRLEE